MKPVLGAGAKKHTKAKQKTYLGWTFKGRAPKPEKRTEKQYRWETQVELKTSLRSETVLDSESKEDRKNNQEKPQRRDSLEVEESERSSDEEETVLTDIFGLPVGEQVEIAIRNQQVKKNVPPHNLNGRYYSSAWEQPLTMAREQYYTSLEEVPKHRRQFYPTAIVPRAAWETEQQRQELERRVENIHGEAHARALRVAQKEWMEYTKLMSNTTAAQGKWKLELHKQKHFIKLLSS